MLDYVTDIIYLYVYIYIYVCTYNAIENRNHTYPSKANTVSSWGSNGYSIVKWVGKKAFTVSKQV